MKTDLHTHTIASGHAFGTIMENAKEAAKKGIKLLGITDHGPAVLGSACKTYFECANRVPKNIDGVKILFGAEVSILDSSGKIDLPENILEKLDYVIAGFHENCGYIDLGVEKNTEAMINTMKNPYVKIIAHPYSSIMEIDIATAAKSSMKHDVLMEINASYFLKNKIKNKKIWSKMKIMAAILKEHGAKMILNSDAHNPYEVGKFKEALAKFGELGISEDDLLNSNGEEVLKLLKIR